MSTKLVIVESPNKVRSIAGYLGPEFDVEASVGHIRDLPQPSELPATMKKGPYGKFAVDVEDDFTPYYVVNPDKKKTVAQLKKALKEADELYLATDDDREGEAIAWHLQQVLKPKVPVRRMVFTEITREAVTRALDNTRELDIHLVDAQETRRILDRLVGYEVSPVLWRKVRAGLSAGRVQSVATRLVVERERERMAFRSASYWGVEATFSTVLSAVDVTARQEMRRLVARRCAEERLTLLLVTHDVLDLTALAEDVVVLDRGRVVEQGPTARVLSAPRSDFVAHLTGTAVLTGVVDGDAEAPGLRLPSGQVIHGRPREDSTDGHVGEPGHRNGHDEVLHPGAPGIALVPPDAVALYRLAPHGSPRNVLTGRVTGLERSGALVSVRLELEEGQRLSAAVTAGAVAELGITEGREVCCVIKAVQVRILARRG